MNSLYHALIFFLNILSTYLCAIAKPIVMSIYVTLDTVSPTHFYSFTIKRIVFILKKLFTCSEYFVN